MKMMFLTCQCFKGFKKPFLAFSSRKGIFSAGEFCVLSFVRKQKITYYMILPFLLHFDQ